MLELNNSSTTQILENVAIKADNAKGEQYFEGSVKFMKTLNEILDMLIFAVSRFKKIYECNYLSNLLQLLDLNLIYQ